jgi:MFS family permease
MNQMFSAIIVLGIAYAIYKLFELFVRRKERMVIIEKMSSGECVVNFPDVSKWFSSPTPKLGGLRLGLLLIGLGLGLAMAIILNSFFAFNSRALSWQDKDILYFALMMLFGGLGLLVAYLIEQKNLKKE